MANSYQDDEIRARLHEALYGLLIEKIDSDQYPSATMMDMVEQGMRGEQVAAYAEALLNKVSLDRYPSIDMMRRLIRLG
jgi:hypothetical protein